MSSNKTTNLNLHKWVGEDYVLRTEFNDNFDTVDTEIHSHKTNTSNPHNVTKSQVGLSNVDNVQQATKSEFNSHTGDTSNPHSVTKSQVGLGSVPNYSVATQAEAEAGTTDAKLMTPLKTKQSVDKALGPANTHMSNTSNPHGVTKAQVGLGSVDNIQQASKTDFDTHVGNTSNPHGVTKSQVGLSSVPNYSVASSTEAQAGTLNTKFMTPLRTKEAIDQNLEPVTTSITNHTGDKTNPHSVTKSQVGLGNVDNVQQATKTEFNSHTGDTTAHITATERNTWNAKVSQTELTSHTNSTSNPHAVTKSQVGLSNVDNIQQATKTEFNSHNGDNTRHITATERTNWNAKAEGNHTHTAGDLPNGTTGAKGVVQLSTSISSTSTSLAGTASAVKTAYDRAVSAESNAKGYTDTEIEKHMVENTSTVPISEGLNVVSSDRESSVDVGRIQGKTVVNHVPLFDSGAWAGAPATIVSPTRVGVGHTQGSLTIYYVNILLKPSTTYTFSGALGANELVCDIVGGSFDSTGLTTSKQFDTFTTPSDVTTYTIRVIIGASASSGTYVVENLMLNEGSTAQEFVANVKGLTNPTVIVPSKNLFDINRLNITSGKRIDDRTFELNFTAAYQTLADIRLTCLGNTVYTIKSESLNDNYYAFVEFFDSNGNSTGSTQYIQSPIVTFNTPIGTEEIRIAFANSTTGTNNHQFSEIMLVLGDATQLPNEYVPYETNMKTYLTTAYEGDEIYEDGNGNARKTKKIEEIELDGTLDWAFGNDQMGYKNVGASIKVSSTGINNQDVFKAIKYNGKVLETNGLIGAADRIAINSTDKVSIVVSIKDTDSGWGENYTPTQYEIKAYFMGWRMCDSNWQPYNGTGTKYWSPITDFGNESTSVLPVTQVHEDIIHWQPYRLIYELAKPQDVAVETIGEIELHEGLNQVELVSGVIRRERVYPFNVGSNTFTINNTAGSSLKNRVRGTFAVYKNGNVDTGWNFIKSSYAYGDYYAQKVGIDETAVYEVDYIALPYQLTTSPTATTLTFNKNINTQVNENVKNIVELKNDVSVIEQTYARKEQPGWIEPTLLNGIYPINGAGYRNGFYKDDFGVVHVSLFIDFGESPANSSKILYFPTGYRPSRTIPVTGITYTSSSTILPFFGGVMAEGSLLVTYSGRQYTALNFSFRAEQ
jgi:hypothetical protein